MNDPSVHITSRIRRIGPAFGAVAAGALLCAMAVPIQAQQESAAADAPVATDHGEAELRAMREEHSSLQAEMEELKVELTAAREEAALKTEQVASLESETASLQTQLETAQSELAAWRDEAALKTERVTSLESETASLQTQLETAQSELAAWRDEAALKTEQVTSLESETASLQTQLETAQSELAAAQEDTTAATARLTDVRAELERETRELQTRLSAMQQELAAVTADRDEIQAAGERELEALRAMLPPDEGGTLDLDAARAAAGEQARVLRDAHQAMNRRGANREVLQAALDQATTELHRAQSLVNRIQGGTLYQVRTGDTLAIIAARLLGDTNQWPRVFEANRHVLENPDQVWPGTTLIVP